MTQEQSNPIEAIRDRNLEMTRDPRSYLVEEGAYACTICGNESLTAGTNRCRFERGCLCWRGYPCGKESRGSDSWARTARILAAR